MAGKEKVAFCQVDAHLDTNPKIRKAGRNGREIFLFILRRVVIARTDGEVSLRFVDPEYLADQLMMTPNDAADGLASAVTAGLLALLSDAKTVKVVGWSKEWGYFAKTGAERQAKHAAAKSAKSNEPLTATDADPSSMTSRDENDVIDKNRIDHSLGVPPPLTLDEFKDKVDREADAAKAERTARRRSKRAKSEPAPLIPWPDGWQPSANQRAYCREHGIDCDLEVKRFENYCKSKAVRYADYEAAFWTRLHNEVKWRDERGSKPANQTRITATTSEYDEPPQPVLAEILR